MNFKSLDLIEEANKLKKEINNDINSGKTEFLKSKIEKYEEVKKESIKADILEEKSIIEKAKIYSINEINKSVKENLLCLDEKEDKEIKELENEIKLLRGNI
ncbi:hypothetical protein [Clostridium perfringens]|uniref:hypothetical protein n=1 Tax=Clostridium perfringens TaxID=1502 RepID=UPI000D81C749|nr:hypothetical protein [Clostridium perfringens]MBI6045824.1 hypothetical protein [Clostridium perfringens]MCC2766224.1 hypothetical protein [Clostridium perfringens]MCG4543390.1 hypothetical protein [Clostridium perfringens]MCG4546125.1 hypothetical protein [Clostridium perfringens]MCG4554589.1 hypothetical protein [Clostridium perfringens]